MSTRSSIRFVSEGSPDHYIHVWSDMMDEDIHVAINSVHSMEIETWAPSDSDSQRVRIVFALSKDAARALGLIP